MAIADGDRVRFAYIDGTALPENPDDATLYIMGQLRQIYLGSLLIASDTSYGADYNSLVNRPQIEGITLAGNKTFAQLGITRILFDTTAGWASKRTLQSEANCLYIYTDHQTLNQQDIPGLKVGDGNAYLIDLPFMDAVYMEHIADSVIHVSAEDREKWDNKVTCYLNSVNDENLIFSKD